MNYWWVNHKQTVTQERSGNFIWSPHVNKDGSFNQTYLNLSLMQIGDIVFSYAGGKIGAIGRVIDNPRNAQKPMEFGLAGEAWSDLGYFVQVEFHTLETPFHPKMSIDKLAPLLPNKYSPIRENGNGNQKCYLAAISKQLSYKILDLLSASNTTPLDEIGNDEDQINRGIVQQGRQITITEKSQLVLSRRGQGVFRKNVFQFEKACRISGATDLRLLRASHIKPWALSNNQERIDGYNGLLLAPHIDLLFDQGFISFSDDGSTLVNEDIDTDLLSRWGVAKTVNVGSFRSEQKIYLRFHRENIFRG